MHLNDDILIRFDKEIIGNILLNYNLVIALIASFLIWCALGLSYKL